MCVRLCLHVCVFVWSVCLFLLYRKTTYTLTQLLTCFCYPLWLAGWHTPESSWITIHRTIDETNRTNRTNGRTSTVAGDCTWIYYCTRCRSAACLLCQRRKHDIINCMRWWREVRTSAVFGEQSYSAANKLCKRFRACVLVSSEAYIYIYSSIQSDGNVCIRCKCVCIWYIVYICIYVGLVCECGRCAPIKFSPDVSGINFSQIKFSAVE